MDQNGSQVSIRLDTTNQENESNNIYDAITGILHESDERFNKTIKYRNLRIQAFCITVEIAISYIMNVFDIKIEYCEISSIYSNVYA